MDGKFLNHGRMNPAQNCDPYWSQSDSPLNLSGVKRDCNAYPNLTTPYSHKNYGSNNSNYYSNRIHDYRKQYYASSQRQSDYYSQLDINQKVAHSVSESNRHPYQGNTMSIPCARMDSYKSKTYTEEYRAGHQPQQPGIHQSGGNFSVHPNNGQMHYSGVYNNTMHTSQYHPYGNHYNHSNNRVPEQPGNTMGSGVLKGGKKRVKNMFTALFAHCQVCGDRATGFHYGADTCEACKVSHLLSNSLIVSWESTRTLFKGYVSNLFTLNAVSRITVIFAKFTYFPRDVSEMHTSFHSNELQFILHSGWADN